MNEHVARVARDVGDCRTPMTNLMDDFFAECTISVAEQGQWQVTFRACRGGQCNFISPLPRGVEIDNRSAIGARRSGLAVSVDFAFVPNNLKNLTGDTVWEKIKPADAILRQRASEF